MAFEELWRDYYRQWRPSLISQNGTVVPQLLTTRETKGAAYCDVPFVLFLHGRASIAVQAERIVFDEQDYRECYDEPSFTGGLLQLLSSRACVFVGFSFKALASIQFFEHGQRGVGRPSPSLCWVMSCGCEKKSA